MVLTAVVIFLVCFGFQNTTDTPESFMFCVPVSHGIHQAELSNLQVCAVKTVLLNPTWNTRTGKSYFLEDRFRTGIKKMSGCARKSEHALILALTANASYITSTQQKVATEGIILQPNASATK